MAKDKKVFSDGVFADALIGNFFIAIGVSDVAPSGWDKMDGGFIPGQGLATFPNFAGSYIRGGSAVDLVQQGTKTHQHVWPGNVVTDLSPEFSHLLGLPSAGASVGGGLDSVADGNHDHTGGVETHDPTDHEHAHTITAVTEVDPVSHIPLSRVINWIGKVMSTLELDEFALGTIFGFTGTLATIPVGWALCNGAAGTPNLISKFIRGGDEVLADGSDDHQSTHDYPLDLAGLHNHGGATSNENSTTTSDGGGNPQAGSHNHSIGTDGQGGDGSDHTHNTTATQTGDLQDLKPPYITLPYIKKIVAQTLPNINIALNIYIFFDPSEPGPGAGWLLRSDTGDIFDDRYTVGRSVVDVEFGNLGPISAAQHQHSVNFTTTTDGAHAHLIDGEAAFSDVGDIPGAVTVPSFGHTHTASSDGGHAHVTTGSLGLPSDSKPASVVLQIFQKTI